MNPFELLSRLKSNPIQVLSQKFNLPQNANNPQDIIQHLLNTGQVTQDQVNWAMRMQNSPIIQQLLGKK